MSQIYHLLLTILLWKTTSAAAPYEVLFLISSQEGSHFHRQLSANLRNDIVQQSKALTADYIVHVSLLHEIYNHPGEWTLLPALARLQGTQLTPALINNNTKWIIVCEGSTEIKLQPLLTKLRSENHKQPLFLGYPLYDQEATIIHHFAFFENPKWFPYPMLRAGVILSVSLLKSLADVVNGEGIATTRTTEFSIDAAHELARFILDNVRIERESHAEDATANDVNSVDISAVANKAHHVGENNSPPMPLETKMNPDRFKNVQKMILQKAPFICPKADSKAQSSNTNSVRMHEGTAVSACAMYAKPMETTVTSCLFPIKREQIFVAIKTCQAYQKERIPVIKATWAPYTVHKRYYGDIADASIPIIGSGLPNVETGHCEKTLAILKLALKDIEQMNREALALHAENETIRWLLLSDDDTLLSIARLCNLLACFNHTDMIYLGERYGYRLHAKDGFNYITGGGGIVLSLPTVSLIVKQCSCPSATSPDDMILGACLHTLGIQAIHSTRFHQARPNDYPHELLELEQPISFHKFWQLDPLYVYERWFASTDREILGKELLKSRREQRSKLLAQLKVHSTVRNKSRFATNTKSHCQSNQDSESIATSIDARKSFSLASIEHESSSHLDL